MLIGELARRSGVSARSLRHYERHGLLTADRTANGWRDFAPAAERRARRIAGLIADGLTLEQVQRLAPCLDMHDMHDAAECDDPTAAIDAYRSRLTVLEARLADMRRRRDALAATLVTLES